MHTASEPFGRGDERVFSERAHDIDEIAAHLGAAVIQSLPSDDQIIMGHVRDALALAKSLQRQLRQKATA